MSYINAYFFQLYQLSLDAAPWLLLGLFIAGLIKAWLPSKLIEKTLKGENSTAVFKGVLYGIPLPLCSCSVLPVAISLKRNGASNAATNAFLISTPTTGVDSIMVSYALLGPVLAIARPIAAAISGILAGLFSLLLPAAQLTRPQTSKIKSCCKKNTTVDSPLINANPIQRSIVGIQYALTDLFEDIIKWLIIGLLVAAAVQTFIPTDVLAYWGQGPLAMLIAMLIGFPMYICATASTPVAASLLLAGVSPGTVLVFLLAGPACNIATLGVIKRELGKRNLIAYFAALVIGAMGSGLTLDYFINAHLISFNKIEISNAHQHTAWYSVASLILLVLIAVKPYIKNIK